MRRLPSPLGARRSASRLPVRLVGWPRNLWQRGCTKKSVQSAQTADVLNGLSGRPRYMTVTLPNPLSDPSVARSLGELEVSGQCMPEHLERDMAHGKGDR